MSNDNDKDKTPTHARAKNQTVMLTPEITGQVRAMLQQEDDSNWEKVNGSQAPSEATPPAPEPVYQAPEAAPPAPEPRPAPAAPQYIPQASSAGGMYLAPLGDMGKLVGFLICYDKDENGQMLEIRTGRWLVSNAPAPQGSTIVMEDESVSSLHAIFRVSDAGTCQVMDQLAEYGTSVIRYESGDEEEIVGSTTSVDHGDVIRFGDLNFTVVLIPSTDTDD